MYEYVYKRHGNPLTAKTLSLYWEVNGDPITDDYTPDEISAHELLDLWVKRLDALTSPDVYGPGMVHISWFVAARQDAKFEFAPFQLEKFGDDWLDVYTWPVDTTTRERVNFLALPVEDKLWDDSHNDKGGFIQSATGWKPSPLQPSVHVPTLLAAAGLSSPGGFQPWRSQ